MTADHVEPEEIEAVFYDISEDDTYSEVGDLRVETHTNDEHYPLSIVGETEDGREIGLTLDHSLIRRIVAEAWVAGII